jgi:RNA polymerase sigma-70 factor (ECF subfamily)
MNLSGKQRSNEDWIAELSAPSPECDDAVFALEKYLNRGLSASLRKNRYFNEDTLNDLVQDSIIRILDKLDTFRGKSGFLTWAMKVAVNLSVTELRRKQWKNISLDGLETPETLLQEDRLVKKYESPEKKAIKQNIIEIINKVVREELPPKQKKVLTAAFFHEIPLTVIAEEMGTSKNTVYKIIHDARKHIKSILEKKGLDKDEIFTFFS